jgi:hypothetical protein
MNNNKVLLMIKSIKIITRGIQAQTVIDSQD